MRKLLPITLNEYQILRVMGLVETMCFTHTNDYGHWYVKDNQVHFKYTISPARVRKTK